MQNTDRGRPDYVGMSEGNIIVVVGDATYKQHYSYKTSNKEDKRAKFKYAFEIMNRMIQRSL